MVNVNARKINKLIVQMWVLEDLEEKLLMECTSVVSANDFPILKLEFQRDLLQL